MNKDDTGYFEGYASIFEKRDLSGDIIKKGAFSKTLIPRSPHDIKMLYQHKTDSPIGYWTDISEKSDGLYVKGNISLGTNLGNDIWVLIKNKVLDGLSIGFQAERAKKGRNGREISQIYLWEISIVTFPMAPGARINKIGLQSLDRLRSSIKELNNFGV